MIHFVLLVVFSASVGLVLGAMLRRRSSDALRLALWITLAMVVAATAVGWLLYWLAQ